MKFKTVFRWDSGNKVLRLFSIMWCVGTVGDGKGYSAKITVALAPRFFMWRKEFYSYCLTIAGLRVHFAKNFGGIHV